MFVLLLKMVFCISEYNLSISGLGGIIVTMLSDMDIGLYLVFLITKAGE